MVHTMRELVPFLSAAGKTIEAVFNHASNRTSVVAFTDGTFSVIGIYNGWDPGDQELVDDEFDWREWPPELMKKHGFVSDEDLQAETRRKAEADKHAKQRKEADERAIYEKLRRKFEGTT